MAETGTAQSLIAPRRYIQGRGVLASIGQHVGERGCLTAPWPPTFDHVLLPCGQASVLLAGSGWRYRSGVT